MADDKRLDEYQPYWAARAELLARLGRATEATAAYDRAIGLERDPAVRASCRPAKLKSLHRCTRPAPHAPR